MCLRRGSVVLLGVLLVVGLSAAVSGGCDDECSGAGCELVGYGTGVQVYFNRCVAQACGNYSPYNPDCQDICKWRTYYCERMWPLSDYYCDHITHSDEGCLTQ